jgi:hypothetical protein
MYNPNNPPPINPREQDLRAPPIIHSLHKPPLFKPRSRTCPTHIPRSGDRKRLQLHMFPFVSSAANSHLLNVLPIDSTRNQTSVYRNEYINYRRFRPLQMISKIECMMQRGGCLYFSNQQHPSIQSPLQILAHLPSSYSMDALIVGFQRVSRCVFEDLAPTVLH